MKFTCERQKLAEALSNVQRAVSPRSTIAALEGIKITTKNNAIELQGYNLEIGIQTKTDAQIEEEGSVVLGARLFTDIVRRLPEETVHVITDEKLSTVVESGGSKFTLTGISPEDFPELPEITDPQVIEIPAATLKSMIKQTIFAVADVDTKPIHTGTLFDIRDKSITLVSVDGYRLALRKETIQENEKITFVAPGKALSETLKLIHEDEDNIKISAGNRHIIFETKSYKILSRLLDGEFLDYKSTIPESCSTKITAATRTLLDSIERVSLLITERLKSPVRCNVSDNIVKLSCTTSIGKATDQVQVKTEGQSIEIGFNSKYMADALKNTDTDEIEIQMNGPLSPIKILPKDGDSFLFLVLPVKMRAE